MGLIMPLLTFPRDMPERDDGIMPFETASFDKLYGQTKAPTRGGQQQVVELARDLWTMEFSTHRMYWFDALDYQAWTDSLRGGRRLFKAWHPHLRYPIAYHDTGFAGLTRAGGSTAFDGTCTVDDHGVQLDTVSVSGLPSGFKLTRGDMISIPFGSSQTLHRIIVAATADGGGLVTLTIEPTLPISFVVSPEVIATFFKPWCLACIDADSIRGPFSEGEFGTVSFTAVQTF